MLLWTRVSLGTLFAATAVAATALAWHSHRECPAPPARPPAPPPVVAEESQAGPVPQVEADTQADEPTDTDPAPDDSPDPPTATAGDVDDVWLPREYVRKLSPEDAADLVTFVDSWVRGEGIAPAIEYRTGVVFAESREDRGDDGPLPRSAEPEGERVCGTRAVWMRSALEKALENAPLTCSHNICWYGGMEYAPSGYLVFRPYKTTDDQPTWALDAWIQVYDAGLPPKTAHHNENDVLEIIDRLPKACRGEPAGAY